MSRIWAKLGIRAGFGPSRIWIEQDLGQVFRQKVRIGLLDIFHNGKIPDFGREWRSCMTFLFL